MKRHPVVVEIAVSEWSMQFKTPRTGFDLFLQSTNFLIHLFFR